MAKTMNGKLGIAGAFNRRRTLSPLQSCHSSSPNQDSNKESYSKILSENKVIECASLFVKNCPCISMCLYPLYLLHI